MRSDPLTQGINAAPQRSLLKALGLCDAEIGKPLIGVVSSKNDIVPGHMNLDKIVDAVKQGVALAGGVPIVFPAIAVCDGLAMGHTGMKYSLVSRELIADSTEAMSMAHPFDGLVLVAACDKNGVRIAELDEMSYRRLLWSHRPLTDFWRVGPGYAKKLEANAVYTMGDIARCSIENEDMLYRLFGVNAELLIDHAWGWEPCTIAEVKAYKPENNSTSSGQVLQSPYPYDKALIVIKEMAELSTLDLVEKGLVTDQIVLDIVYDVENLKNGEKYAGEIVSDRYGRRAPKPAHGTVNIGKYSSSTREITAKTVELFERIVNKNLSVRKLSLTCNHLISETEVRETDEQMSLFDDFEELEKERARQLSELEKEKKMQKAMLKIKGKYGKNAVIKGLDLQDGATTLERNGQIGGHKA